MIRVLHVVTIMNRAGLESRLMDIYRNIDRSRIQFDFYTNRQSKGDFDEEILSLGGRVFYSNPILLGREIKKVVEFESFLRQNREYRIIHSHVNEWSALYCIGAKKADVPNRIVHSRGANKTLSPKTLYKNILKQFIKRNATHYLAVSKEAGIHLFGEKAFNEGTVNIFPNAIETSNFRFDEDLRKEVRRELGIEGNFAIFHVGNLSPVKNHNYLLKIFIELRKIEPASKLVLIGEGEERKSIEKFIDKNKIGDAVQLLGKRSDVPLLLQAADCFIFPSFHEGFPGAVLEAETSGLPCYISDTITKEVVLTNKVRALSIKLPPKEWAEEIVANKDIERTDSVDQIVRAGYDIKDLCERMAFFYEAL